MEICSNYSPSKLQKLLLAKLNSHQRRPNEIVAKTNSTWLYTMDALYQNFEEDYFTCIIKQYSTVLAFAAFLMIVCGLKSLSTCQKMIECYEYCVIE